MPREPYSNALAVHGKNFESIKAVHIIATKYVLKKAPEKSKLFYRKNLS